MTEPAPLDPRRTWQRRARLARLIALMRLLAPRGRASLLPNAASSFAVPVALWP